MVNHSIRFAVIGGDLRQIKLMNILAKEGYLVNTLGLNKEKIESNVKLSNDLREVISNSDIIIGPIPCSKDNKSLYSDYLDSTVMLEDIFKNISENQVFIAGNISPEIKKIADNYKFKIIDLLERDDLAILNAIPTSEGAIQYAMENSEITIHGSKSLVLGFGRCGKVLAHKLKGLDTQLTVLARKSQDLALIKSYGYNIIRLENLENSISNYDYIFNTIPFLILNKNVLSKVNKSALIIDLASKPGGVDYIAAKELGIHALLAPSLPGKVAPLSAALIIYDSIFNLIRDMGVII
ncbi:MAG TPA: dipicolinate synthase subunit DpsA [Defluviitaleaceae bacterium]|nr:dipicolinate synthase subunit DpsA [Candidatus Epulonipiscium sp.]HOA79820.1 dipicolinate synthase subunit DpsA [Defluviitaleaceae bacterium]